MYVSYLGLVREAADSILHPDAKWQDCYGYFPWEDLRTDAGARRHRQPPAHLGKLCGHGGSPPKAAQAHSFVLGVEPENWSEEYVLQRYEMLYESGLIAEAAEPQANFDFALTGQPCATTTAAC